MLRCDKCGRAVGERCWDEHRCVSAPGAFDPFYVAPEAKKALQDAMAAAADKRHGEELAAARARIAELEAEVAALRSQDRRAVVKVDSGYDD